ncbi:MAG: hypothetical protein IKU19_07745 [Clostridia bacterium]|nr:hypothetical protein [Clostridia bacterium]
MKKFLALLLTALMLISLVACGTKDPETPDSPGASDTSDKQVETNGDGLTTSLFSIDYDKDEWILIEDDVYDEEDYCFVNLQILDPEDPEYYLINVEITANVTDPYDFREDIVYYGFDQYDYAVNNAYDLVDMGGVDCLKYEGESWGDVIIKYLGRAEAEGTTVEILVNTDDANDSRIAELLDTLKFTLTDTGNVDGPWEWEGEAFSAEDASVAAGSFTVETKWLPINEYISTYETFDHAVAAVGNTVYILTDGVLRQYAFDGSALNFEKDIELPEDDYDIMEKTEDGTLWLCGSMNDLITLKDGAVSATYEDLDNVAVSPDGSWGISYFTSNECEKVTFSGGSASTTAMVFTELDMVSYVKVDKDAIYVCGSAADESGHKVFIYNTDGVLQKTLCDAEGEGLGSITYFAKTANGYIGFDGNMRDVLLWDSNGAFIAELSDSDLFSTGYPWFCGSDMLSDGSIITVMTDEREDQSAEELVAFLVKGF